MPVLDVVLKAVMKLSELQFALIKANAIHFMSDEETS